jgi:carbon-monoxide dehydrogenase medium subunit
VSITLPKRGKAPSDAYLRLIPRTEMDIAVVGVGVSLSMKGDTVKDARVGSDASAPRCCWSTGGQGADRLQLDDASARARAAGLLRTPASRSTTSAAPSGTAPRSRACC